MAKQDWTLSTITLGHLQKLAKLGFMAVAELKTCRVPKDHALPGPVEGYVVSFVTFHERGFDVPPHPFLHSLLWYYGLELHHLTPSGILHIAVFITLWYKSQGTGHRFPHPIFSSSYQRQHSPCSFHPYHFRLSDLGEMAHGDDRGKRPCNESSSHGCELPPPHRMRSVAGAHFMHALRR
jgi:hypothetical protein